MTKGLDWFVVFSQSKAQGTHHRTKRIPASSKDRQERRHDSSHGTNSQWQSSMTQQTPHHILRAWYIHCEAFSLWNGCGLKQSPTSTAQKPCDKKCSEQANFEKAALKVFINDSFWKGGVHVSQCLFSGARVAKGRLWRKIEEASMPHSSPGNNKWNLTCLVAVQMSYDQVKWSFLATNKHLTKTCTLKTWRLNARSYYKVPKLVLYHHQ